MYILYTFVYIYMSSLVICTVYIMKYYNGLILKIKHLIDISSFRFYWEVGSNLFIQFHLTPWGQVRLWVPFDPLRTGSFMSSIWPPEDRFIYEFHLTLSGQFRLWVPIDPQRTVISSIWPLDVCLWVPFNPLRVIFRYVKCNFSNQIKPTVNPSLRF